MNIVGKWEKATNTECSDRYPERIEFKANGIYYGKTSSNSEFHPIWDVGSFHWKGEFLSMSTSNDAVIDYKVLLKDDILSFQDMDGCRVEYKKN